MSNKVFLLLAALFLAGQAHAASTPLCWGEPIKGARLDINGNGDVQGAWILSESALPKRLQSSRAPLNLLVSGYDVITARRVCEQIAASNNKQIRLVFGGRERLLFQQGLPAWQWLVQPANSLASNLVQGDVSGIFVGKGKAVIGKGLEQSKLTDPAQLASILIERFESNRQPVVVFVGKELQQRFLAFYSNNPLPGVFLSFDDAELVKDSLNKYAHFKPEEQAGLANYYCR